MTSNACNKKYFRDIYKAYFYEKLSFYVIHSLILFKKGVHLFIQNMYLPKDINKENLKLDG